MYIKNNMLFDCISVLRGNTCSRIQKFRVIYYCFRTLYKHPLLFKSRPVWGTKKLHRNIKLLFKTVSTTDPKVEETLASLRASVKEQADYVRQLKATGAPELDVKKAIADLKQKKRILDDKELELMPATAYFDRAKMEDLLRRRFYYNHSFSIYGGVSGQYDFGPIGCTLKTNILNTWRRFFVLEEQMLEVDCSILTPEPVLKASGHVDRFADFMVKDTLTGECFRLDYLIKSHLEKIILDKKTTAVTREVCEKLLTKLDGFNKDELQDILIRYDMKSPLTGHKLSDPMEFNLMVRTQIGPSGLVKGFLRPETAQGIFVNFKRLLEFNNGKLPFAAAQIGNVFRNEISPRSGLLRVREFTMAEIEHFCDPDDKSHEKFSSVADQEITFYSACNQMDGKSTETLTIGEAVRRKLVTNETLGYFMARIYQFLTLIGIDNERLRFRQHMSNEMAHYACDCWDAECLTSFGWTECVGCADRSTYDLTQHYNATGVRLATEKRLHEPEFVEVTKVYPAKNVLGKVFGKDANAIIDKLNELSTNEVYKLRNQFEETGRYTLTIGDRWYMLTEDMLSVKSLEETKHVRELIPNVIEPSFGIGRIMYSLFEHNFRVRKENVNRTYIRLSPIVAPIKCSVLPLGGNEEFVPLIKHIASELRRHGISHKVDDSPGSIGKRYTRSDEIAIPFNITVDFDSLKKPHTITLREMNSTNQIRLPVSDAILVVKELTNATTTWKEVENKYPKFVQQETTK